MRGGTITIEDAQLPARLSLSLHLQSLPPGCPVSPLQDLAVAVLRDVLEDVVGVYGNENYERHGWIHSKVSQ